MRYIHVLPLNDLREHVENAHCWCHPRLEGEAQDVVVHNALDGREDFETGKRKPS